VGRAMVGRTTEPGEPLVAEEEVGDEAIGMRGSIVELFDSSLGSPLLLGSVCLGFSLL